MRYRVQMLVVASLLIGLQSAARAADPYAHVIIVGDSLMATADKDPYTSTTAMLLNVEYGLRTTNISRSGQLLAGAVGADVGGTVAYLTAGSVSKTAVWITLGHNDWFLSRSTQQMGDDYRKLVTSMPVNVDVFCVVPPIAIWDYNHELRNGKPYEHLRNIVRFVAHHFDCQLVETADWVGEQQLFDGSSIPDGVHFSGLAHAIYASKLLATLRRATVP